MRIAYLKYCHLFFGFVFCVAVEESRGREAVVGYVSTTEPQKHKIIRIRRCGVGWVCLSSLSGFPCFNTYNDKSISLNQLRGCMIDIDGRVTWMDRVSYNLDALGHGH